MFSKINSIFSAAVQERKIKNLEQSACLVAGDAPDGFVFGNGVFLSPDIILTCLHNLSRSQYFMAMDYKRNKAFATEILACDKNLDIAILQLEKSLQGRPAQIGGDTEYYLHDMQAFLVNYYDGTGHINPSIFAPTKHAAGIDMDTETRFHVPFNSVRRTFTVGHSVVKGFSGSPIFDSRGLLSSMVCSVIFNNNTIQGVTSHRLCDFIHTTLGTSPQKPLPDFAEQHI